MKKFLIIIASIYYHPSMILFSCLSILLPFKLLYELGILLRERIPTETSDSFFIIAITGFLVFIAMVSRPLGKIYRKLTLFIPLVKMSLYTSIALCVAINYLNKWADNAQYSKGYAILYAILAIAVIRFIMSLVYWKYPVVRYNQNLTAVNWISSHRYFLIVIAIVAVILSSVAAYGDRRHIREVQETGIGKGFMAGTTLGNIEEDNPLLPRDFHIVMKEKNTSSRALLWNFASKDGDIVTVKINGEVLMDNIIIKQKPIPVEVPIPSTVEVVGIKSGGGEAINYAIKFSGDLSNSSYYNIVEVGSSNAYRITVK